MKHALLAATTVAVLTLVVPAAAQTADPVGWDACRNLVDDPAIWPACAEAVSQECVALRESEGDLPWATCLKIRAEDWEKALVDRSTGLRFQNNPAGDSAALSRWMSTRAARCHRQSEVTRMTEAFGETIAAAAVFQCELASNIEEAVRLDHLLRAE